MSKKLQNYPDPMEIFDRYGSDALRYYLLTSSVMLADNLNFAENGVGEDRNVPVIGNLTYFIYPGGYVSGILGYNFSGKLSADDANGNLLYEKSYNPSPSIGFIASFRL